MKFFLDCVKFIENLENLPESSEKIRQNLLLRCHDIGIYNYETGINTYDQTYEDDAAEEGGNEF